MNAWRPTLVATAASLAVGGCAPTIQFAVPEPVSSVGWTGGGFSERQGASADLGSLLASATLAGLTERALLHNSDIAIADARVAQAEALLRGARMAGLPEVSASAGISADHDPGAFNAGLDELFVSLDLAVDLDVFGRLRAARQSAAAQAEAAALTREAITIAIEAEVAEAYVQSMALDRRIRIVDQNIVRAQELERIIRIRFQEGAASRVDLGLQSVARLNFQAERARLLEAQDNTRTALAILVGAEAPLFGYPAGDLDQLALPILTPESPAALLVARPDIRAAEALIVAAEGDVRQARASFFPQAKLDFGGLISGPVSGPLNQMLSLGSSLLAPIFSQGRLETEFRFASAVQVEAVETYRKSILFALAEVENANAAMRYSAERAMLLEQIVFEAEQTARLANLRYLEGEEDLQNMLDAQEFLADAEEAQVQATQAQLFARIALYRAGGGFRPTRIVEQRLGGF